MILIGSRASLISTHCSPLCWATILLAVLVTADIEHAAAATPLGDPLDHRLLLAQVAPPAETPDTPERQDMHHGDTELRAAASAAAASAAMAAEGARDASAATRTLVDTVARTEGLIANSVKELNAANTMIAETRGQTEVISGNLKTITNQLVGPESTLVKISNAITNQTTTLGEIKSEVSEKDPPQSILGSLDRAVDVSLALGIAGLSLAMLTFGTGLSSAAIKNAKDDVKLREEEEKRNTSQDGDIIVLHRKKVTEAENNLISVKVHEQSLSRNLQMSLWAAITFVGHAVFVDSIIASRQNSSCIRAIQESAECLIAEMKTQLLSNRLLVFLDQGLGIALFAGAFGFLVFGVLQYRSDVFRN